MAAELGAAVGHGVGAGGEAGAGVVGDEALVGGHGAEGRGGAGAGGVMRSRGPTGRLDLLDLPDGVAAVGDAAERVEGADAASWARSRRLRVGTRVARSSIDWKGPWCGR